MTPVVLSYDEARNIVAAHALEFALALPLVERVSLNASAGRVLAEPLHADRDQPPFNRSTRDGFACRASELAEHAFLHVAGSTRAGEVPARPLQPGTTWEIMTGAPVPEGANAVVMLEHVEYADGQIRLAAGRAIERGENVVRLGGEARQGDELVPAGTRLAAAHIAVAASCGYSSLPLFARPRVAILTTGDELVSVDSTPGPGQIRNSNAPMLAAMVVAAGGRPLILPRAADELEALEAALVQAANADLLLISGGVSAGKFDLVEEALARAGAEFHFAGVRIQPGKPAVFGRLLRGSGAHPRVQPFLGLPGNPISSAVTFLLFAAPLLAAISGSAASAPRFAVGQLARECLGKPGLTRFVPAVASSIGELAELQSVEAVPWQGSGDLAAFARSNCFLVVPEGVDRLPSGEIVRILLP
jgi:molybdopterin molybdotransferase